MSLQQYLSMHPSWLLIGGLFVYDLVTQCERTFLFTVINENHFVQQVEEKMKWKDEKHFHLAFRGLKC